MQHAAGEEPPIWKEALGEVKEGRKKIKQKSASSFIHTENIAVLERAQRRRAALDFIERFCEIAVDFLFHERRISCFVLFFRIIPSQNYNLTKPFKHDLT